MTDQWLGLNRMKEEVPLLGEYSSAKFDTGAGRIKRLLWYVVNAVIFDSWLLPFYAPKRAVLRVFGASVADTVVMKPRINIKYPWNLSIGENTWIGEGVWIDNLAPVRIGSCVCISQGAMLLTGNHDYKDKYFGLITAPITLEDGVWIGARATIGPGVICKRNSIVTVGGVATQNTENGGIYSGVPVELKRQREFR